MEPDAGLASFMRTYAMTTACTQDISKALIVSLEIGQRKWLVTAGVQGRAELFSREVGPGEGVAITKALRDAKRRLGLAPDATVFCCYEAGHAGFWPYRLLESMKVSCIVVDPSSIEVDRRAKRTKTDRIDGRKRVSLLERHLTSARKEEQFRVVRVPTVEQEAARQLNREIEAIKKDVRRHKNRIDMLLMTMGARRGPRASAAEAACWDDTELPKQLQTRLRREEERLALAQRHLTELTKQRKRQLMAQPACEEKPDLAGEEVDACKQMQKLAQVKGIDATISSAMVRELGWRKIKNVRQLGALTGLAPSRYQSGTTRHEQGITKAGNKLVRSAMVQAGHLWRL